MKKQSLLWIIKLLLVLNVNGQNCFNSDFEDGTLGGYQAYLGKITKQGLVLFNQQGADKNQHKIMSIKDGYDPIAYQFCSKNKNLLTVGNGTGRYTLRLGDETPGSFTSKIVLSLEVTDDVSFFLLKYAVVLEDPDHDHSVQPRFELNVLDENGNSLDCGEYKVRAAIDNPGFETCAFWRVRPWTTAGFELSSHIGKKINIEIISTDCGLGAHAGYAYIDATCKPLTLNLSSYCPESSGARYEVVEGFDKYLWNTGDTTRFLDIKDPVPGTPYSVTVTSATGCTLVLQDTLPIFPKIDSLIPSHFLGDDTIKICQGNEIVFKPKGVNITNVKALDLNYVSDVFYLYADSSKVLRFETSDNFGCIHDTMHLHLDVEQINVDVEYKPTCQNTIKGEIWIDSLKFPNLLISLDSGPYTKVYHYTNLKAGNHLISIMNSSGCILKRVIFIDRKPEPEIPDVFVKPATCNLDNGIIKINNNGSYLYKLNSEEFGNQIAWTALTPGDYTLHIKNSESCEIKTSVIVHREPPPQITSLQTHPVYCGLKNGMASIQYSGGYKPVYIFINEHSTDDVSTIDNLESGTHQIVVKDYDNCSDTVRFTLEAIPYAKIDSIITSPNSCTDPNGQLHLFTSDNALIKTLKINEVPHTSFVIDQLPAGTYQIIIEDINRCLDSVDVEIVQLPILKCVFIDSIKCIGKENRLQINVETTSFNGHVSYFLNGNEIASANELFIPDGTNTLSIMDDLNCKIDIQLEFDQDFKHYFPNVIALNSQSPNNVFCINHLTDVVAVDEFYVIDKWGNFVYTLTSSQTEACWDGTMNGTRLEQGVYVYQTKFRLQDGSLICKYGDITLLW